MLPIASYLKKNKCNNLLLSNREEDLRACLNSTKELCALIRSLGYFKRQPFKLNLFHWLPEAIILKGYKKMLSSKFAEIAFALHIESASGEFAYHANELKILADSFSMNTPHLDRIISFLCETDMSNRNYIRRSKETLYSQGNEKQLEH